MLIFLVLTSLTLQTCLSSKVILVSLDGFRHDYIEMAKSHGYNVSAFEKITELGFRAMKVNNVMLSLTFPSHYSMATGRYTETHGLVGNSFWDPGFQARYKYTNSSINLESRWFEQNGNEPIWLTNQRLGHKSGLVYWPAQDARLYGQLPYVSFGLYSDAPTLRYRVDRVMDWITQEDVNFIMMYFPEPDKSGHRWGPNTTGVFEAIQNTNDGIAYLMQRVDEAFESGPKPNIIVTSDHGMTEVNFQKVVDVNAVLNRNEYKFGVDGSPANMGIWPKSENFTDGKRFPVLFFAN